jgi:hypothetical protein
VVLSRFNKIRSDYFSSTTNSGSLELQELTYSVLIGVGYLAVTNILKIFILNSFHAHYVRFFICCNIHLYFTRLC